jgi:hypothetical protein
MHAQHDVETHRLGDTWLHLRVGMDTARWCEDARWLGQTQGVGEVTLVPVPLMRRQGGGRPRAVPRD